MKKPRQWKVKYLNQAYMTSKEQNKGSNQSLYRCTLLPLLPFDFLLMEDTSSESSWSFRKTSKSIPVHQNFSAFFFFFHSSTCGIWEPLTMVPVFTPRYLPSLSLSSSLEWWDPGAVATVFWKREASWLQHTLKAREKSCTVGPICHCVYI